LFPTASTLLILVGEGGGVAVPWLMQLIAGLSKRRPGFVHRSARVGFVEDKVALRQVFLRVLRSSPVNINRVFILIYNLGDEQ
jgi:hypothetical protein